MGLLDFFYILPLFSVALGSIVLMIVATNKRLQIRTGAFLALFFLIVAFAGNMYNLFVGEEIFSIYPYVDLFGKMIIVDTFSSYFSSILILGAILTIIISLHYMEQHNGFTIEFFSLFLFSVFGMVMLVHAHELIVAFISLEIASLSLYVMIGFEKINNKRIEASFKYLVLGSLAGVFFLLGTALIYAATQSTKLGEIGLYISSHIENDMTLLLVGMSMILILFLFKIAAFPFQNWSLDVYDGAPLPVTSYMAATFKAAIFGFILRFILVDFEYLRDFWDQILVVVVIATLLFGSFLAIIQTSIKRMLVASSIVHTGYMLIGFISINVQAQSASSSIVFYLVAYFLSAIGAFGLISYISSDDRLRITYDDFRGFARIRPYMAAMMSVFMLSLAGIPSTIGFVGKFYIFTGAIEAGYSILAVFGILATFVSVYYYFRLIAIMYFYPSAHMQNVPQLKGIPPYVIGFVTLVIIWGGIGSTLISFFPGVDFFINMANLAYKSLFLPLGI